MNMNKISKLFTEEDKVKLLCSQALDLITLACKEAEENKLTDKQWYLIFEDTLNSISVKDHSNKLQKD